MPRSANHRLTLHLTLAAVALAAHARQASACSFAACAVAIREPPVANFSSNAVFIPVESGFPAIEDSVYFEEAGGRRIAAVVHKDVGANWYVSPAETLGGRFDWYTLKFNGRCVPFNGVNIRGATDSPGEFSLFVGEPEPEPTRILEGLSVAEQTIRYPGTEETTLELTLSIDLTTEAEPHLGRVKTALSVGPSSSLLPTRVEQLQLVRLRTRCTPSDTPVEQDSCGTVDGLGEGDHELTLAASMTGSRLSETMSYNIEINCASLLQGKAPLIWKAGTTKPSASHSQPTPSPSGTPGTPATGANREDGGCTFTKGPRPASAPLSLLMLLAALRLARRRDKSTAEQRRRPCER